MWMLSHTEQTSGMLISWDKGHFFLITRALLVIKRAWFLDADWLNTPTLSWFPSLNGLWKRISEMHRFRVWSKRSVFILAWNQSICNKLSTVLGWKSKKLFPSKSLLIRSLRSMCWDGWCGTKHRVTELYGCQTESWFLHFASWALLVSQVTLSP